VIGDVRGAGLYIGVEFVSDKETKNPDSATALAVTNAMRQRGVLISATGRNANVLKIRPPLVFSSEDVSLFLNVFKDSLVDVL
jgi:4-aminobutyrate aminotransferase-like enzyme